MRRSSELRRGRIDQAFEIFQYKGQISLGLDHDDVKERITADWVKHTSTSPEQRIILTKNA